MKLFVPGRICLFGEHSDWAGGYRRVNPDIEKGYTLISGTEQGIYADVGALPHSLHLTATTVDGERLGPVTIPMEEKALLDEAQRGGFWSYIAGVAYQALLHYQVGGIRLDNYRTTLPIGKGLSSSAAICVLTARAFNRLYDLKLTVRGEMELAYQGEITTPSRCGRMDQGCAFGNRAVLMTFDGDRLETREIRPARELFFVIADLGAQKNTHKILEDLNRVYPIATDALEQGVQAALGATNKRIVHNAAQALQSGDAIQIGHLMKEAQDHFDRFVAPACPEELQAPLLHQVLNNERIQPLIWGGKGIGSQGDGAVQFIARSAQDQQRLVEVIEQELGLTCLTLSLQPSQVVRKAVIPAAGFGTRLFPATKAMKKELFPVVDRDGVAKPAILILIEEALEAGIEELILIVQEEDLPYFQEFFSAPVSPANFHKLPPEAQEYAQRIIKIGHLIRYVIQPTQDGFGHAVFCAREAVGSQPFLLMLGDHVYRSETTRSCTRQMLEAYHQYGGNLLGLRCTSEEQISSYGTITGVWIEPERLLKITQFAEKPSVEYARENLTVPGLPQATYLTVFGQYILEQEIFTYLEENILHNIRERGEIQLTTALERLRKERGFLGLMVQGRRFDLGMPNHYLETLRYFRDGNL